MGNNKSFREKIKLTHHYSAKHAVLTIARNKQPIKDKTTIKLKE